MDDAGHRERGRARHLSDLNRVRRADRAVEDDEWIRSFLETSLSCVVATESNGQPFATPLVFAYDAEAHCVYFHAARAGRLFANLASNPRTCLSAFEMGRLAGATKASGFNVEYGSVTVFGSARVLADAEEAAHGLRLLLRKYFPALQCGVDYDDITGEDLARTAVYRLDIGSWSGKQNPRT